MVVGGRASATVVACEGILFLPPLLYVLDEKNALMSCRVSINLRFGEW